jgi:hypothetical protein
MEVLIDPSNGKGGTIGSSVPNFGLLMGKIISIAGIFAGIVLVAMLVIAGFNMMSAAGSGDAKKTQAAEKMIIDALIGFLIIVAVYLIIQLITSITGVPILNATI